MYYFPILKAPKISGYTTLCNFPPNNWEIKHSKTQFVFLTYMDDGVWFSKEIGVLNSNELKTFYAKDIRSLMPDNELPLLSLSAEKLPRKNDNIPKFKFSRTSTPWWRATLGLYSEFTSTSYQGELPIFPACASLLSFSSFLQFGDNIENYVLIVNIEESPVHRPVEIEIYDAEYKTLLGIKSGLSNQINIISLDGLGFNESSLPVIICRDMAAIPLYFSKTKDGKLLSLEHTHPPASLVTHGDRFKAQKHIKEFWFSQLKKQ